MIETFNFICIKEILNRVLRHPLMKKLNLEDAVYYSLDFIRTVGLPQVYENREEVVHIEDYRGLLPCDCVMVHGIQDTKTGKSLRHLLAYYSAPNNRYNGSPAYKINGDIIYTNFKDGDVLVSYEAIPVDKDGLPMLPDDPTFMKALELYIKKEWFTVLYDTGEIDVRVLNNTQAEYASAVYICKSKYRMPSEDEMESLGSIIHRLLPNRRQHATGWANGHDKESLRVHNPSYKIRDYKYE